MRRTLWLLVYVCLFGNWSQAEEPTQKFLNGLRERGFYDVALEYLNSMQSSPLASAEWKANILYERGVTLIAASRAQNDQELRTRFLSQAEESLKQFIASQSSNPKLNAARSQLGTLIAERARLNVFISSRDSKPELMGTARALYEEAAKVLADLNIAVKSELDAIPKVLDTTDRKQAALIAKRKQLRADNLETQLLAAAIQEELAATVGDGSVERNQYLTKAASLYESIYKDYRTRLAGLYARLYQGRCNQRLGRLKDALGYYGELLDQPDEPDEFRQLKTQTLRLAMECWLDRSQKKYLEAIRQADPWIRMSRANEDRTDDWLSIRLNLARAYRMQADDSRGDQRVRERSLAAAKTLATFVANEKSDFQEPAVELLERLGVQAMAGDTTPKSFDEADEAGKEMLASLEAANKSGNPEEVKRALDGAISNFRLALSLADQDTARSKVNFVRYFLCYLHYLRNDHYESTLLGEFVARRYPDATGAVQCGKIALASLVALYEATDENDVDFESERIIDLSKFIANQWPGGPEAQEAISTLVPFLIHAEDLDDATKYVEMLPESLPGRLSLEIAIGQALWGRWVQASADSQAAPEDTKEDTANLDLLAEKTTAILGRAYSRMPDDQTPDQTIVTAMLSLAQAYVETLRGPEAVEVLEHSTAGPLSLLDAENPLVKDPVFQQEVYRTGLRAYIGSLNSDPEAMAEKAKALMQKMQQSLGADAATQKQALGIYVSLAQDIQRQMEALESGQEKTSLSKVFEAFLQQLSASSTDLSVLNWVAETFASLGAGFETGTIIGEEAKASYRQSITAFNNLLGRTDVSPETARQLKIRVAELHQKIGEHEAALKIFQEVLDENPLMINVQVKAAQLLQDWGQIQSPKLNDAMRGVQDGNADSVWGWAKIASTTVKYSDFRDAFYLARYSYAQCSLQLSRSQQGKKKQDLLSAAAKSLVLTKRLYPTLGGESWTAKYETLLKEIQSAQGKPAIGFGPQQDS